ncbi:MAG: hypothetical protein DM484_16690 [Candidatus Methylumidiphilus alinenensis]|uniref:Ammonium transporter AmtB-like domain-containing protein n=1 Tax=Candidatus Methylumidiphilus alinenensis TaxID=2202197 RepID=A0A2W4SUI7_9GAMM|nr:MAG: hypothetical protein DM484_16690 [Candidatus Methylumidiphilus alinenensis]
MPLLLYMLSFFPKLPATCHYRECDACLDRIYKWLGTQQGKPCTPLLLNLMAVSLPAGIGALSIALLMAVCLVFAPGQARATGATPQQEMQGKPDDLGKSIASLRAAVDRLGQDTRSNAKSIEDIKAKLEENSILVYQHLSKDMEAADRLEELAVRVRGMGGGEAARVTASPPPAVPVAASHAAPSEPANDTHAMPLRALASALLTLIALLGFALLEASQLENWAVPQAGLRNLLLASALGLTYFAISHWEMLVEPGSATNGDLAQALCQTALASVTGLVVATILSDRLSLPAYLFLAVILGAAAYPVLEQWVWSGQSLPGQAGWLERRGFVDFAGATTIHSFAAWFALAWSIRLPLSRTLAPTGDSVQANASLGLLGLSVVWFGWFGIGIGHSGGGNLGIAPLALNILLAGAAALLASLCALAWVRDAMPDAVYARICAATVGGLVAVSAGVACISPGEAVAIGILAGLLQPAAYRALSARLIKDDQVAANLVAAHGICGMLGTLCVGLFASPGSFAMPEFGQLEIQLVGIAAVLSYGLAAGFAGDWLYQGAVKLNALRVPTQRTRE